MTNKSSTYEQLRDEAADDYGATNYETYGNLPNIFADVHFKAGADWEHERTKVLVEALTHVLRYTHKDDPVNQEVREALAEYEGSSHE